MKVRQKLSLIAAMGIFSSSLVALPTSADGAKLGGKWTTNPKTITTVLPSAYQTPMNDSIVAWNSIFSQIGSARRIDKTSVSSSTVTLNAVSYGNTSWNAQGQPGPSITSGTYTYGTMRLNRTYMDAYTARKKRAISAHEWGHLLGLAHRDGKVLMNVQGSGVYYDQWGIFYPTSADKTDLDQIY